MGVDGLLNAGKDAGEGLDGLLARGHHGATGDIVEDGFEDELFGTQGDAGIFFRHLEDGLEDAIGGGRVVRGKEFADDGFELFSAGRGDLAEDELLLREVVEEGGAGDAGFGGDHLDGDLLVAVGAEELEGNANDFGAGLFTLAVAEGDCT